MSGTPTPEPDRVRGLDDVVESLRALRVWAGNPSYAQIARRVATVRAARGVPADERTPGRVTVYDCFRTGRRRVQADLLLDIVAALHPERAVPAGWREAVRAVLPESGRVPVHTELPAPAEPFVGRHEELRRLRTAGSAVLITGMPGAGKTQLAIRAVRGSDRGADGRYLVDLGGYDARHPPAAPGAVLTALLVAFGEPAAEVYAMDLPARSRRWRALVAARDVQVVLDNAAGADQVLPLLPGAGRGQVLVTSRRLLPDLPGTSLVRLPPLDPPAVRELLVEVLGAERVRDEPDAAARLGRLCGNLPLDLAVTAAHLARSPDWTLDDQVRRLAALPRGTAVRPALLASYHQLPATRRRLFRLLAVHPGGGLGAGAVAALAELPRPEAASALSALRDEHLLEPAGPDRYELHDLVRDFARHQLVDEEPHSAQQAALDRLLDHYRDTAVAAAAAVPGYLRGECAVPDRPRFDTADAALSWLGTEWAGAIAAALAAANGGRGSAAVRIAHALGHYLRNTGRLIAAESLHRTVAAFGSPAERAHSLRNLGGVLNDLASFAESQRVLRAALALADGAGDAGNVARITNELGNAYRQSGELPAARDEYRRAAELARAAGDRTTEARALTNLSNTERATGDLAAARTANVAALALVVEDGDAAQQALLRGSLAGLQVRAGEYGPALDQLATALELARQVRAPRIEMYLSVCVAEVRLRQGDQPAALAGNDAALRIATAHANRYWIAVCRANLAAVHLAAGRPEPAAAQADEALAIAADIGDRMVAARALAVRAGVHVALGEPDTAHRYATDAVAAARQLGDPYELGQAYERLGEVRAEQGCADDAARYWELARSRYAEAGDVDADRVAGRLAAR